MFAGLHLSEIAVLLVAMGHVCDDSGTVYQGQHSMQCWCRQTGIGMLLMFGVSVDCLSNSFAIYECTLLHNFASS